MTHDQKKRLTLALAITTYNSETALRCLFDSIMRQSTMPDEIIIADDGSTDSTPQLIEELRKRFPGNIKHIWQENLGYRRSKILNKAIAAAESDYIVTIDNDVLLHPQFVADHKANAEKGYYACGRRSFIKEEYADIIKRGEITKIPGLFSGMLIRPRRAFRFPLLGRLCRSRHANSFHQMMGSNTAFWKSDFIAVNGFEEEFVGWGPEDKELCLRFNNIGIKRRTLQYCAIQYHLNHPVRSDHPNLDANENLFKQAEETGKTRARKGVDRYLNKRQ